VVVSGAHRVIGEPGLGNEHLLARREHRAGEVIERSVAAVCEPHLPRIDPVDRRQALSEVGRGGLRIAVDRRRELRDRLDGLRGRTERILVRGELHEVGGIEPQLAGHLFDPPTRLVGDVTGQVPWLHGCVKRSSGLKRAQEPRQWTARTVPGVRTHPIQEDRPGRRRMNRRSGVIVAGGRSVRMGGAEKTVVDVGGTPLIRRVADRLSAATEELVVNCRSDQRDAIAEALGGTGPALCDRRGPGPGPGRRHQDGTGGRRHGVLCGRRRRHALPRPGPHRVPLPNNYTDIHCSSIENGYSCRFVRIREIY